MRTTWSSAHDARNTSAWQYSPTCSRPPPEPTHKRSQSNANESPHRRLLPPGASLSGQPTTESSVKLTEPHMGEQVGQHYSPYDAGVKGFTFFKFLSRFNYLASFATLFKIDGQCDIYV